jgi:lipopolysaccharide biosynthesis glycosyltransferase
MNVIVHNHDPIWRPSIEQMRQNGNSGASNLFLHPGNYFGTWQRIDIPLFVDSEYCLLLDSDTIIKRPFTLADFGSNLTRSIAMSAEGDKYDPRPWNAGVMLMNIPYLRKTQTNFVSFIMEHVNNASFPHPAPSDQGAYLSYYKDSVTFLDTKFNFKPYWYVSDEEYHESLIIHFHGAKPHDYLMYIMGEQCDDAIQKLCEDGYQIIFLCQSLREFARSVNHINYCASSFPGQYEKEALCIVVFETIATEADDGCYYFESLLLGKTNPGQKSPYQAKKLKKKSTSLYNKMFRGIKNYQTRRMVRIAVSWILFFLFIIIICIASQRFVLFSKCWMRGTRTLTSWNRKLNVPLTRGGHTHTIQ